MTQQKRSAKRRVKKTDSRRIPNSGFISRLIIMLAVVVAIVFGVAVFFKVSAVEVQGNTLYSAKQIIEASGIQTGDNLLTVNKAEIAGNIMAQLPYVEKVSVGRSMPDTIVLSVQESTVTFAVTTDTNTVWLINSQGKALERYNPDAQTEEITAEPEQAPETPEAPEEAPEETEQTAAPENEAVTEDAEPAEVTEAPEEEAAAEETAEEETTEEKTPPTERGTVVAEKQETVPDVPQIIGVTVHNPTAGTIVTAVNQSALDGALAVMKELSSTGILVHVTNINVEKEYNIIVSYDDQYEIELGPAEDLSYKVQYLTAILDQLSQYQAGTIDLTFTEEKVARFHPKA